MKNLTVESANKLRNRMILWIAVSWPFLYLPIIYFDVIENGTIVLLAFISSIAGAAVTFTACYRLIRLQSALRKNPGIASALSGEINVVYHRKTLAVSFTLVMLLLAVLPPVLRIYTVPAYRICMLVFFFGILSYCITWLIYNRD